MDQIIVIVTIGLQFLLGLVLARNRLSKQRAEAGTPYLRLSVAITTNRLEQLNSFARIPYDSGPQLPRSGGICRHTVTMALKRRRFEVDDNDSRRKRSRSSTPRKRPRLAYSASDQQTAHVAIIPRIGPDLLSPLSDELLIRILSFLQLEHLLSSLPVSRRFHRLASDSQLWKALYYSRFVLPRAMRIPGFRDGAGANSRLHYSGRRALWVDGRQGGLVRELMNAGIQPHTGEEDLRREDLNWKRQYKIRHNWSRGKCTVEELRIERG